MEREEIAARYSQAFVKNDVSAVMKLMHPHAIFYDAYWGECSTSNELAKYLDDAFENDDHWYEQVGNLVITASGFVIRYLAFHKSDLRGKTPIYNGAEVFTMSKGLIKSISDHYCDPAAIELIEMSGLGNAQHLKNNVVPLGLSARASGRIKRRLAELAEMTDVFLDPTLTVTQLADHVDCSIMHLFHVLEEDKKTSFAEFVNECRARYATTLLLDGTGSNIRFDNVAEKAGFGSTSEFRDAFDATFGDGPEAYMERCGR